MSVFHEGRRLLQSQLIQVALREKVELGGRIKMFATFNNLKWNFITPPQQCFSVFPIQMRT